MVTPVQRGRLCRCEKRSTREKVRHEDRAEELGQTEESNTSQRLSTDSDDQRSRIDSLRRKSRQY